MLSAPQPRGVTLAGSLGREDSALEFGLELRDYDLFCSPASVALSYGGEPLTVDGEPLLLELHHVHAMIDEVRLQDWWLDGEAAPVRAALLIPDAVALVEQPTVRDALLELVGEREVINLRGEASLDSLELEELPRGDLFHVPRGEKGLDGELFWLAFPSSQRAADRWFRSRSRM